MKFFIIICVLVAMVASTQIMNCPCAPADLEPCFLTLLDSNHDTHITSTEFDAYVSSHSCVPSGVTSTSVFSIADINKDGVVDALDFDSDQWILKKSGIATEVVCKICNKCLNQ